MRPLFFFLFFANTALAQSDPPTPPAPPKEEKSYELFDISKPPSFPGGEREMLKFLSENIKYPALARENNIQGTVALTFVVDKDGSIADVNIIKDIGAGCGKEAVRVVKAMPKWNPGEANGQKVKVRYTLPVRFRLTDDEPAQSPVLRLLDRAIVWEGVRIKTQEIFKEENVGESFKIKGDKDKRRELVAALEGQFQVNIGDGEIKSLKRASDLADYLLRAQNGMVMFSKADFKGKAERLVGERKDCDDNFDCLNFIGSVVVPKGLTVTLFSRPKFKGERLVIDATKEEARIASFFKINFEGGVSTTNKTVNWREEVRSVRIQMPEH